MADDPQRRGTEPTSDLPGVPAEGQVKGGRDLTKAVITALILLGLIIAALLLGEDAFFVLATVVVALAALELFEALRGAGRKIVLGAGPVAAATLMSIAYFEPDRPNLLLAVAMGLVVATFLLALRPGRGKTPATDVAWTIMGIAWVGGGGAAAVSMLTLPSGMALLTMHALVTALDDIGGYFVGTALGKHKLAPSISPAKSWEGFFGGYATALIGGAVFGALIDPLGIGHGLAIGAIIGVVAPVGDLSESLVKRELGIKDSGRMLPGHGGMLDRIDAIMFGAPAVLIYLRAVVF